MPKHSTKISDIKDLRQHIVPNYSTKISDITYQNMILTIITEISIFSSCLLEMK